MPFITESFRPLAVRLSERLSSDFGHLLLYNCAVITVLGCTLDWIARRQIPWNLKSLLHQVEVGIGAGWRTSVFVDNEIAARFKL
jgi:hypothetical protein